MKKLIAIIAFLSIWLSTFAMDYCDREQERRRMAQDHPPYMGDSKWAENNKSMFKRMRNSRLWISQSDDTIQLRTYYEEPKLLGRVFLAIDWVSIWELVYPNKELSIRSIELYYNWQKNKKTVDLHNYINSNGYIEIGFVGVEVPVDEFIVSRYK